MKEPSELGEGREGRGGQGMVQGSGEGRGGQGKGGNGKGGEGRAGGSGGQGKAGARIPERGPVRAHKASAGLTVLASNGSGTPLIKLEICD